MNPERELLKDLTARLLASTDRFGWIREHHADPTAFDRVTWQSGAELGWAAMLVPERYGGGSVSGQGVLDVVEIAEQLGRCIYPAPLLSSNVVAFAIAQSGSALLKEETLGQLASGSVVGAWCMSEESGSFDPAEIRLTIRSVAGGSELTGVKRYVLDGPWADVFLVTGRNESGQLSQVVVRRDNPGVAVVPLACMDLSRRVAEVRFDGATVPTTAVFESGDTVGDIARQTALAVLLQCADSVGAMSELNDMTFEYARERFAFGRPIGSFQAIQIRCVEMYLGLIGARAVTSAAAEAFENGASSAIERASIAKSYVGDAFSRNAEHAHQIHGGIAYTWEHDAHIYTRHAKFNEAMFGSPTWHRDQLGRRLGI